MQHFRSFVAALLLVPATACFAPTGPGPSPIDGVWAAPQGTLFQHAGAGLPPRAVGADQVWFSFDGESFLSERHVYGGYEGEPPDQLSQVEQLEGTFWITGNRLTIETKRLVKWVRSEGESFSLTSVLYRERLFDDVALGVNGSQMLLQWTSYPDDSPHLTELALTRSSRELQAWRPLFFRNRPSFLY